MQLPRSSGRFSIEAKVGSGGMGDVYRAVDRKTGERVAIKLLRKTAARDEQARFRREIAVLADLRHPNLVQYVDHGTWADGRAFLAMEWLEGEDLQARTRTAPLGTNDAVEVVRRAAAALAAVHARGVVHRDLKLSNIWLVKGRGLRVKVIDFGVVKPAEPDDFVTQTGAIIGTPHYMAPEQARGEAVTPRSDVYALGAVLFRLVTGRVVFPTEHVVALLGQLVLEDPPLASAVRFDVVPALDKVIAKAIARAPEDRYGDAGELARALARVGNLSNEPPGRESSASSVRRVPPKRESLPPKGSDPPPAPGALERRVVATVVAALAEPTPPPELEAQLRPLMGEGDRLQVVQGQRLLLAFGVRRTNGDEILRAARAALLIARVTPSARVAIASGQATRRSRGISADALERAAVQLDRAAVGGVRVDGATAPLLAGRFLLREDAVGATLLHEDAQPGGARKLLGRPTPTVGRDKEVSLLGAVLREVVEERSPRGAIVVGAAGIGKSRIRYEVLRQLRADATAPEVLVCRGDPMIVRGGISSFGRALRTLLGVQDGEPAPIQETKVRRYVEARRIDAPEIAEFLGEVIGVHFPDDRNEPLRAARQNPVLMQARIRAALEAIVRADADRAPQLLVIEDMHWADELTLDVANWLLGSADLRFAVFGFARPNLAERGAVWSGRAVTRIEVAPLSFAAAEKLVAAALPESTPDTRRMLADRAGGNALFLEELIRQTAEKRNDLPLTVQALIQLRLDALAPDLRLVARAASVFGRSCWSDGVRALVGREVDGELEALAQAEVLTAAESSRISGQREWTFHHGLVRDAVYASLLEEDLPTFHAKAGAWLEAAGEEDFATLARHAALANERRRAASFYARATDQAFANGNMEAVLELADKGIACADDAALRTRLGVSKAQVAFWLAKYDVVLDFANQVLDTAPRGSPEFAEASRLVASVFRDQGKQLDAEARLEAALAPPLAEGYDAATLSRLLSEQARTLTDLGRSADARACADRAMELAMAAGAQRENARLRAIDARFIVTAMSGSIAELTSVCRAVIDLADAAGDLPLAARGRCNLGHSLNTVGKYAEAKEALERAARDSKALRVLSLEGYVLHNLGLSLARMGQFDAAMEHLRAARRVAEELGQGRLRAAALQYEAIALAWRAADGDLANAHALSRDAEQAAMDQPWLRFGAKRVHAYVQLRRRAFDAALELTSDAWPTGDAAQPHDWEELVRLTRAEALLAIGDDDEANATLRDARAALFATARSLATDERRAYLRNVQENVQTLELAQRRLDLSPRFEDA